MKHPGVRLKELSWRKLTRFMRCGRLRNSRRRAAKGVRETGLPRVSVAVCESSRPFDFPEHRPESD